MKRINHATSSANLFGTAKPGFTGGSISQQIAPTVITPEWANDVQEELANAAESIDTLDASNRFQLVRAIRQESDITGFQTLSQSFTATSTPNDAASGSNGSIVVVCEGALGVDQIYSAPDGWNFNVRAMGSSSTNALRAVASSFSTYCAVGVGGEIQTSNTSGVTWTKRTAAGGYVGDFESVARLGSLWIAAGDSAELQTSPDGIAWTKRTMPAFAHLSKVAVNQGVAVASGVAGANYALFRSTDGITWSLVSSGVGPYSWVFAVPGGFIAVASGSITSALLSTDYGATWHSIAATSGGVSLSHFSPYSGLMTQVGVSRVEGWDLRRNPNGTSAPIGQAGMPLGWWLKRTHLAWVGSCQTNEVFVSRWLPPLVS